MKDVNNVKKIIAYIEQKTEQSMTHRHMVTAEMNHIGKQMRKDMYNAFRENAISVDIRGTKTKKVCCPSSSNNQSANEKVCPYSRKPFDVPMQAEVDVAIVMKVMNLAFHK